MTTLKTDSQCGVEQKVILASSLSIFLGGVVLILLWRAVCLCYVKLARFRSFNQVNDSTTVISLREKNISFKTKVKYFAEMLLSAQTYMGRMLVILVFFISIGTLVIYFLMSAYPVELCDYPGDGMIIADLSFNMLFAVYFGVRFIAAKNKLKFWLELNSLVDFFTIPPVCVSIYLGKNWLGLRFLRAVRLIELPKILQLLKITKTGTAIKLSNLLAVFLSTWLTAAGFLHLLENTGDPWTGHTNRQHITYFDCIYLLMVTMSTVGYGDITAKTVMGRIFLLFFIVVGLALFAHHVPEIMDIVGSNRKFDGLHVSVGGRKHIVVCGYITVDSVTSLLRNFKHEDRGKISTDILFMEEIKPNLDLEAVFKCNKFQITFFHGSVLSFQDLKRVKMEFASACIVLADKCCANPEHEDMSNIMRVISIKNYYPQVRIIIQILKSHNKRYLQNIPAWDSARGDSIICLAELKLGILAQSCLVPGFSTVLINLCSMKYNLKVNKESWQYNFLDSLNNLLMTETLSRDFVGMTFSEACRLCFDKMDIVLIAIEYRSKTRFSILVNPSARISLHENTTGFFISRSPSEVKRASLYCKACHTDITIPLLIKKCPCRQKTVTEHSLLSTEKTRLLEGLIPHSENGHNKTEQQDSSNTVFDSSGMFHWCKAVEFEQAILTHRAAVHKDFHDHIVVNIFGGASSTLIGLQDFVMPLRTSNFTYEELKQIVFIGHIKYLKREWKTIQNFPKLFIFPGSGLSWANLRAVSVQRCCMSVIMSSNIVYENKRYLEDTECILATLNLSSMQFKETTSNIAALRFLDDKKEHASRIPVITELKQASNITFIEQENSTLLKHPETKAFMTTAFATGSIFSPCFLDSLMCMAYFDRKLLALLQILVTGCTTPEVEDQLAEKNRQTKSLSSEFCSPWDRCKLSIIPVTDSRLSPVNGNTYEYLFNKALISLGIICFGIYRLMDAPNRRQSRYVITRPPKNFPLLATDMLYCIVPYRVQPCATQSLELLSPMENGSTIHSKEDLSDTSEDESATSFKVYM